MEGPEIEFEEDGTTPTEAGSAAIKRAFREHFAENGEAMPADLPPRLKSLEEAYPLEWAEACEEHEAEAAPSR